MIHLLSLFLNIVVRYGGISLNFKDSDPFEKLHVNFFKESTVKPQMMLAEPNLVDYHLKLE